MKFINWFLKSGGSSQNDTDMGASPLCRFAAWHALERHRDEKAQNFNSLG